MCSSDLEAGNVIWYDNENGEEENNRRSRLLERLYPMDFQNNDLYFQEIPQYFFRADKENLEAMHQHIETLKPALIIIDSLVSIFPDGTSENVSTEVRSMMNAITSTVQQTENPPAVLILSHTKKSAEEDGWSLYRGSSDIQNSVAMLLAMRGVEWENNEGNKTKREIGRAHV